MNEGLEMPRQPKAISFYASYYEVAQRLTDAQRLRFYDGIMNFAFGGVVPDFEDDPILELVWISVMPNVQASVKKSLDGQKGGRPKGKTTKKTTVNKDAIDNSKADIENNNHIHSHHHTQNSSSSSYSTSTHSQGEGALWRSDEITFEDEDIIF